MAVAAMALGLVSVLPSAASAATCPAGKAAVTNYSFKITHLNGTVSTVSYLAGVMKGDKVEASFSVAPGCGPTQVSLASYRATNAAGLPRQDQVLFDSSTGFFLPGPHPLALSVMVFGVPAPAGGSAQCTQVPYAPGGNGANQPGPYDPTCDGSPSLNGNGNGKATGKPCAGCVGNADAKNPPGQMPNGNDPNAGYECDRNNGVGKTNPAHTGCTFLQVDFVYGPVLTTLGQAGGPDTYSGQHRLISAVNG